MCTCVYLCCKCAHVHVVSQVRVFTCIHMHVMLQVEVLTRRLEQTESLVEEAIEARQQALQQLAHTTFQASQMQR